LAAGCSSRVMPKKRAGKKVPAEEVKYNTLDEDYLRRAFDAYDIDKSGYLEKGEAIAALSQIGSKLRPEDLDRDGDGRISFEEFSIFSTLVGKHTFPIWKHANKNFASENYSKTGISVFAGSAHLNEAFMQTASSAFRKLGVHARAQGFSAESLRKAYDQIDTDGDGVLDFGEIRKAIKFVAPQLNEMDICVMLSCADKDNSSNLTFDEFKTLMLYDHESDVPYWEKYGDRDMHIGLKDRRHQVRH